MTSVLTAKTRKLIRLGINLMLILLTFSGCNKDTYEIYRAKAEFISGFKHPEDMVLIPHSDWLLTSNMVLSQQDRGAIIAVNLKGKVKEVSTVYSAEADGPIGPEVFSPHGIALLSRDNLSSRLFVVNHGTPERIEVFDVDISTGAPQITWVKGIDLPPNIYPNAVAVFPDGSLAMTSMYDPSKSSMDELDTAPPTGQVWFWNGVGWRADTQLLSGANGIEVSADGNFVYVTEWAKERLWRIDLKKPENRTFVQFDFMPDNVHLSPDGILLVAGQDATVSEVGARFSGSDNTPIRFTVVALNPTNMKYNLLQKGGDKDFDCATGAMIHKQKLWVCSPLRQQLIGFAVDN